MTPSELGYAQCMWCKCWRPKSEVRRVQSDVPASPPMCSDHDWCAKQTIATLPESARPARNEARPMSEVGWDANGAPAPTGLDENGDAL